MVREVSTEPLFSVVIPTVGRESLRQAVESVLCQSLPDFELIVVVDGDDFGTEDQLSEISDSRLRVFGRRSSGVSAARNTGIAEARGKWVTFLDDDDEASPQWLEAWHSLLGPDTSAVTGRVRFVSPEGRPTQEVACRLSPADPTMGASLLLAGGFTVRRSLLAAVGGYDEGLRYSENTDLGLRLCDALSAAANTTSLVQHIPEVVVQVRVEFGHDRVTRYREAHGEAAKVLLGRHSDRLSKDPVTEAALLRVLSNSLRFSGDQRGAVKSAWRACRTDWWGHRNWRVLVAAIVPWLEIPVRRASGALRSRRRESTRA